MKKIIALLIIIIIGVYFSVSSTFSNKELVISKDITAKYVDSNVLYRMVDNILEEKEEEEEIVEEVIETVEEEITPAEKPVTEPVIRNEIVSTSPKTDDVKETLNGKMSAYGPDCSGCSGYLGSGRYVGDGNIYYEDATYGRVRIVAGDSKYSYGTIVRINDKTGQYLAIVLDRGGGIGINKKYMFDLLFSSESEASNYGISNASFEILRYGY